MDRYATKEIRKEYNGAAYKIPIGVEARNVETNDNMQFISKSELEDLKRKPGQTDPVTNNTVVFTQASARTNIKSGEKLSVIAGKISKFFADLKTAAFREVTDSVKTGTDTDVTTKKALKEVNDNLGGLRFYEDGDGKWVIGADSVPKKLGDTRDERAAPASILLNFQYPTVRNVGIVFSRDDARSMNITCQNYDNTYEAIFKVEGSDDLRNWYGVMEKGFDPIRDGEEVRQESYDVDLSGYKYFFARNTYISNARIIINSMTA